MIVITLIDMIKITQRIPLETYSYIEFEKEYDSIQEALGEHAYLVNEYGQAGLPEKEWAAVRNNMLNTGECDPNLLEQMNKSQRWFINQLKLALRAITKD